MNKGLLVFLRHPWKEWKRWTAQDDEMQFRSKCSLSLSLFLRQKGKPFQEIFAATEGVIKWVKNGWWKEATPRIMAGNGSEDNFVLFLHCIWVDLKGKRLLSQVYVGWHSRFSGKKRSSFSDLAINCFLSPYFAPVLNEAFCWVQCNVCLVPSFLYFPYLFAVLKTKV